MFRPRWFGGIRFLVILSFVMTGYLVACQVPVFRYALERWEPDRYKLFIISPEVLDDSLKQTVRATLNNERDERLALEFVSLAKSQNSLAQTIWKDHGKGSGPQAFLLYPDKAAGLKNQVAHVFDVNEDRLREILSSPVRQELVKRLSEGHSAVWLLLESGDETKDKAALAKLESQLVKDKEWLKLPSPEELEVAPEVLDNSKIKLKIDFSVIRVKQDDPQESFLVSALLNSEPDLRDYNEPIAFPVFGRGIVLYALVGQGIADETIRTASSFIVGPCSCQVKEQNPGFDLLLNYDWEDAIGQTLISQPVPGSGAPPKILKIPPGSGARQPKRNDP
jgi:hypothetical protein